MSAIKIFRAMVHSVMAANVKYSNLLVGWDSYASCGGNFSNTDFSDLAATASGGSVSDPSRALCWIGRSGYSDERGKPFDVDDLQE